MAFEAAATTDGAALTSAASAATETDACVLAKAWAAFNCATAAAPPSVDPAAWRAAATAELDAAKAAGGGPRVRGASDQKPQQMPGVSTRRSTPRHGVDTAAGG